MKVKSESVLIVEDDSSFRERLSKSLSSRGFVVEEAFDIRSAHEKAADMVPDIAIVDLRLEGESGLTLIDYLARQIGTRVVVLTGYGSVATALEAIRLGAINYLMKPTGVEQIIQAFAGLSKDSERKTEKVPVPSLSQIEWEHINRVLAENDGNVSHAAKALGLHRQSLQRKLRKFAP